MFDRSNTTGRDMAKWMASVDSPRQIGPSTSRNEALIIIGNLSSSTQKQSKFKKRDTYSLIPQHWRYVKMDNASGLKKGEKYYKSGTNSLTTNRATPKWMAPVDSAHWVCIVIRSHGVLIVVFHAFCRCMIMRGKMSKSETIWTRPRKERRYGKTNGVRFFSSNRG